MLHIALPGRAAEKPQPPLAVSASAAAGIGRNVISLIWMDRCTLIILILWRQFIQAGTPAATWPMRPGLRYAATPTSPFSTAAMTTDSVTSSHPKRRPAAIHLMQALALKPHAAAVFPDWHWPSASQQPVAHELEVHGFDDIPHAAPVRTRQASRARSGVMVSD